MRPSATAVAAALRRCGRSDVALHLFDELPSTSRWLEERAARADRQKPAAEGVPTDTVHGAPSVLCAVDLQSAGYGRRGRRWASVRGNVACSLLEHLPLALADLSGLSLVTGIAVAAALREETGLDVRIKWPNDLLVDDAKVGGLLTGVQGCHQGVGATPCARVVSGIGLNVVHDPRIAAFGIGGTSLAAAGVTAVDRDHLLGLVGARVLDAHARFVREGWAAFAEAWRPLDALAGREIDVLLGKVRVRGRGLGVDGSGALRVEIDGTERLFSGGETSIRPVRTGTSAGVLA